MVELGDVSPANMVSDDIPAPVFMKNLFSVPSSEVVVIFAAEAELHPPPIEDTVVLDASRPRSSTMAESTFMVDVVNALRRCDNIGCLPFRQCKLRTRGYRYMRVVINSSHHHNASSTGDVMSVPQRAKPSDNR